MSALVKNRKDEITAIDLFCGAGGFSLAAMNLGIHVLAALENNSSACESYRSYFSRFSPPPILFEKDICSKNLLGKKK